MASKNTTTNTLLAVLVTVTAGVACGSKDERAPEGQAAVGTERGPNRSVINQPLGPIPGPGDLVAVANPLGDQGDARIQGRRLFVQYNCAGCHGGRAGGGMGPSLRDPSWRYGSTPDRIFNSIAQGRGQGMPSWGPRLDDKQLWELTAYVTSLRTPDEPEAPRP